MTTIHFTPPELNWLQSNLQGWGEEKWPGSDQPSDDPSIAGVVQMSQQEHTWFQNLLDQVRRCIMNPQATVSFDPPAGLGPAQHAFIEKLLIDYKGSTAGNYIFKGPYGENYKEGGQFPTTTGSANSVFSGQGSFPENSFIDGANIFNSILQKLGAPQYPAPPAPGTYHSPGEF
jgi:hypothetical protein